MLTTIHTGLSGLRSFQRGLANIGHNIANLNSPGYKKTTLGYAELMSRRDMGVSGGGVRIAAVESHFGQGELRATANPLDVAVEGDGFLVSRLRGESHYFRTGELDVDRDGRLIRRTDRSQVQGLDVHGRLVDLSLAGLRVRAGRPTGLLRFSGNLSTDASSHRIEVPVHDHAGARRELTLHFRRDGAMPPGQWRLDISEGATGHASGGGDLRFDAAGSPLAGSGELSIALTAASGGVSRVRLDFGRPGTLSGVTHLSGGSTSTLKLEQQDGYPPGSLTRMTVDARGRVQAHYTNGQTADGGQLALAWFERPAQQLLRAGAGAWLSAGAPPARIGAPAGDVFGRIAGGMLEMSNVELATEFSELIVSQRGYQAASQLVAAANEMLQQALEMRGRR